MSNIKKFHVYHAKNFALNTKLHFISEDELKAYKAFPSNYMHVANVRCRELGDTFMLTNHIEKAWWENINVDCVQESRSTSVGDIVVDEDNKVWLCCIAGWTKIEWADEKNDPYEVHKDQHGEYIVPKIAPKIAPKPKKILKKDMAIRIASALFQKEVNENNWKVKELMKRKKNDLTDLLILANKVIDSIS